MPRGGPNRGQGRHPKDDARRIQKHYRVNEEEWQAIESACRKLKIAPARFVADAAVGRAEEVGGE